MALDRIALILTVNGEPICYIDEKEQKESLDTFLSQNMHRVFCPVLVKRDLIPEINKWTSPVGCDLTLGHESIEETAYRRTVKVCDLSELGTAVGISDLQTKVQSTTDTVPLINGLELNTELFVDSRQAPPTKIEDLNTVSTGSYTVGSGGSYAVWSTAFADVADLTGNLTLTQISDLTDTGTPALKTSFNLNNNTFLMTSDTNPMGNFNSGRKYTLNKVDVNWVTSIGLLTGASGVFSVSNLNLYTIGTNTTETGGIRPYASTLGVSNLVTVNDCVINCNGKKIAGVSSDLRNGISRIYNIVVAGAGLTNYGGINVCLNNQAETAIIENCTVYSCGYSGFYAAFGTPTNIFRNCASFGNTTDYKNTAWYDMFVKCASSDTTGSEASLKSLNVATEFISTDITSPYFMRAASGSTIMNGGDTALSLAANAYGIRGNSRPRPV